MITDLIRQCFVLENHLTCSHDLGACECVTLVMLFFINLLRYCFVWIRLFTVANSDVFKPEDKQGSQVFRFTIFQARRKVEFTTRTALNHIQDFRFTIFQPSPNNQHQYLLMRSIQLKRTLYMHTCYCSTNTQMPSLFVPGYVHTTILWSSYLHNTWLSGYESIRSIISSEYHQLLCLLSLENGKLHACLIF